MPATVPGNGQKLRNSCDSCNLAKVKCSKGRPSCTRCEAQGVQCIYGISMRAGKHRAQGSNIQKPKPGSPSSTTSPKESTPAPIFPTEEKTQTFDPTLTSMIDTMPVTGDWSSIFAEEPYLIGNPMDLDNDPTRPQPFSAFNDTDFGQTPSDFSMDPSHLMNSSSNFLTESPTSAPAYPDFRSRSSTDSTQTSPSTAPTSRRSSTSQNATCSCNMRVLNQLQQLTQIPEVPSAYHKALNQNKQVISFCHSILEDQSNHSHDISFVLTLTALIAKVIAVYDAIYNPYHASSSSSPKLPLTVEQTSRSLSDPFPDHPDYPDLSRHPSMSAPVTGANTSHNSPFSSTTNLASLTSASPRNGSLPMRLSLGTYMLDEKDEEKLKWDIFKIELSKVGALVGAFERRFCDGMSAKRQGQSTYEAKAYEDMVYYLQKRLRVSMEVPRGVFRA